MSDAFIPYGRQLIEQADIDAVVEVLRSSWLTTGPTVEEFEQAFAEHVGAKHAVAVSNGTAALHLSMLAAGVGPGDEVIVPALTFVASANCVRYAGAKPVFADIRPDTLNVDVADVTRLVSDRTRAIVAVDYAGLPCDLADLAELSDRHGLVLVEDACHALGAEYRGRSIGSISDLSVFSFHPVKHLTTGEGGMITTNDGTKADQLRKLRNHGIGTDHRQRELAVTWQYDMGELGFNYRLTDLQCALGLSQLGRQRAWLERRRTLANAYDTAFRMAGALRLPVEGSDRRHAWHLYPVRIAAQEGRRVRDDLFFALRSAGIGVNVHYRPVYLHSYYTSLGYASGLCPAAEAAYSELLSMPMSHVLSDADQCRVVDRTLAFLDACA